MFAMIRYLKPYRWQVIGVLVFIFLQSLSSLYLPNLMSRVVDVGVVNGDVPYILKLGGWMLLVSIGSVLCSVLASFLASRVAAGLGRAVRRDVFRHVEAFSLHEFDMLGTSSLITRTTNDIMHVQQLINMMLRLMVMAPLMSIGGIIMAVSTDAKLSWVIVVVMPVLALAIYAVMRRAIKLFRAIQKKIDVLNRVLREGLSGVRVIRSFNRNAFEQQRFDDANLDLTDTSVRVNQIMAAMMPMMMLIINLATVAIIWFGGIRMSHGGMQVGDLMAFLQYVMQILFSVMMVSMMFFMIPRASASATRINEVLNTNPDIRDADDVQTLSEVSGRVEFRDVSFTYPGAEKPALEHISFTAGPGEITAIIGGTGAGKSTLVNLIPRFYDVTGGSVRVRDTDVRDLSQMSLRQAIGLVPQKAVLFSDTIAANIRYGHESASDEEVRAAAQIAQASEFIEAMPDGYDARITQGGTNLSGGQKQRLAIARALVRKPSVYIFDDSFSALDFKTDAMLREALQPHIANAAVFIVAQRVSTVMQAHRIIVLDEGRIAGMGTHVELLESCEVYRQIVASQLSEEEIA